MTLSLLRQELAASHRKEFVQASFFQADLSSEISCEQVRPANMLGVANAQLGTAILGLGAAQGMLMSSSLNTLAS